MGLMKRCVLIFSKVTSQDETGWPVLDSLHNHFHPIIIETHSVDERLSARQTK